MIVTIVCVITVIFCITEIQEYLLAEKAKKKRNG